MSQFLWASQICLLRSLDFVRVLKCENPACLVYYIEKHSESEEDLVESMKNLIQNNFEFSLKTPFEWIHRHCTECEPKICPDECVYHKSLLLNLKIKGPCENEEYSNELIFENFQLDFNSFSNENFEFFEKIRVFHCEKCKNLHRYDITTELIPDHFFVNIKYSHFPISSDLHRMLKSVPSILSSNNLFSNTHKPVSYKLSGIILYFENSFYSMELNSRRTWESKGLKLSNASLFDIFVQVLNQDYIPFQLIYTNRPRGPFRISQVAWDKLLSGISEKILRTTPCGKIKYSLNCSCCDKTASLIGWNCNCGQLNHSTHCICGQDLHVCFICKNFSFSSPCPYCSQATDSKVSFETCPVCSESYQQNNRICSNCLNPNPAIFN